MKAVRGLVHRVDSVIGRGMVFRPPVADALPWRGGQVVIGILLLLFSSVLVSALVLPLGNLAGEHDLAVTTWEKFITIERTSGCMFRSDQKMPFLPFKVRT